MRKNSSSVNNSVEMSWFDLPGYKGFYQVSTLGTVRNVRTGVIIRADRAGTEGARVRLSRNGEKRAVRVSALRDTVARLAGVSGKAPAKRAVTRKASPVAAATSPKTRRSKVVAAKRIAKR